MSPTLPSTERQRGQDSRCATRDDPHSYDAAIVVDCRPDARALTLPGALPTDRATLAWVGGRIWAASSIGFEP